MVPANKVTIKRCVKFGKNTRKVLQASRLKTLSSINFLLEGAEGIEAERTLFEIDLQFSAIAPTS